MKLLNRLLRRIEILVFIITFPAVLYMLVLAPVRYFLTWHALPRTSEPIEKIFSTDFRGEVIAQTISNKKLKCNLYQEQECWIKVDYNPVEWGTALCAGESCPNRHILQMMKSSGQSH